jgi:hypothetical protein
VKHVPVNLTWSEMWFGALVGVMRRIQDLKLERPDRYGADKHDDGWTHDIEAALGELALAKAMGVFWNGAIGNLKADDVGVLQVRTTRYDNGRLTIHPPDADDRAFVLITGRAPHFTLRGWMRACDAKQDKWWTDPTGGKRPAFFVPQSELHPIEDILGEARNQGGNT